MPTFMLYKDKIYNAILTGARAVINKEAYLNEINVFPVRDADTGSNMKSLMNSILNYSKNELTLKETLESVSNAALIGSKGNSGLIFSQFIYGLTKDINIDYIDKEKLIEQIKKGYTLAYNAIDSPVEGTMITLMRSWYNLLNNERNNYQIFEDYLIDTNQMLKRELNNTKNQLEVLKTNDVVDAGALAFTIFVDGFVNSLINENYLINYDNTDEFKTIEIETNHHHNSNITFRYCTELLIKTNANTKDIKTMLLNYGDSIVIGESNEYKKIHIHTNNPEQVIEIVETISKVVDSKVDDMKNQFEIKNNKKADICILTDSIADISKVLIEKHQIQVFPVSININDTIYYDKLTIKNERLLKMIKEDISFPKSASPSTISVINTLETLRKYYKKIIVITVSSKMSSTYNIFKNAKDQLNTNDIIVIDSKQNSVSEGLLALYAAKLINEDKSFAEIKNTINDSLDKTNILVHVDSLDNMVKGGRISKGLGIIGKLIRLKPIVSIDQEGQGIVYKKAFGNKQSVKKILKEIKKVNKTEGIKFYAISHVNNIKKAERLKSEIIKIVGFMPEYVTESSAVIALNAGDKAIAVGYIKGARK